jgi:hypothetical protein
MERERIVICIKWGTLYPAAYVNRLFNAVVANLSGAFRFVCLTDDPTGLRDGIESFPIPEMGIPPERFRHGAWPKISILKPDLYGFKGRVLFIDLDTVINGPIDRFFQPDDHFLAIGHSTWEHEVRRKPWVYRAWKDWRKARRAARPDAHLVQREARDGVAPNRMASCVFAFDAGTLGYVYEAFMADQTTAYDRHTNEQHFIELQLKSWTPWPRHWIISYKFQLRQPLLVDWFLRPKAPGRETPMVAFHGDPRPIDMAMNWHSSLREFPHVWIGPVRWMRDYWRRYG